MTDVCRTGATSRTSVVALAACGGASGGGFYSAGCELPVAAVLGHLDAVGRARWVAREGEGNGEGGRVAGPDGEVLVIDLGVVPFQHARPVSITVALDRDGGAALLRPGDLEI